MKKSILVSIFLLGLGLLNGCSGGSGGSGGSGATPSLIASHFLVTAAASATSGTPFNFTVTALDAANNTVTTYSGTVHFTSTDGQATLPADSKLMNGVGNFSATLKTPGGQTITATDTVTASIIGTSSSISVVGLTTHFSLTAPAAVTTGTVFNFMVTALDAANNTVTTYSGTVHFTSTDGQAALPTNSMLSNGTGTFSATLKTPGGQTITATDTVTASIKGTSNSISVTGLVITSGPPPNGVVGENYGVTFITSRDHCSVTLTGWQLAATGGTGSYGWSWSAAQGSSIPPGLTITNSETHYCGGSTRCCGTVSSPPFINGGPSAAGTYHVIVKVTDSASPPNQASAAYTIVISTQSNAVPAAAPASSMASQHSRYRFVDLGTFGGPNSYLPAFYVFESLTPQSLSPDGTFAGWASTADPDPYAPLCFWDCFVDRAFEWKNGVPTPLGALPGPGSSSAATWISNNGLIAGFSENGEIDPLLSAPVFHGVLWRNDEIVDLKTFEGGYESEATAVNSLGQVVGFASNTIYDPNSLEFQGSPTPTQTRAFLWQNGVMKDLQTLGGTDAEALVVNEHGQIVGESYTVNSIPPPNEHCSDTPLTLHAFIWVNDKMTDLDTLGGSCAFANALNNQGQVVGEATIEGDEDDHPFIWEDGKMKDLGTLGGTHGYAAWLNDAGIVVGAATNKGNQALLAFQWSGDVMTNLGTLPGDACSVADAVNSSRQVVGGSGLSLSAYWPACTDLVEHAVLWENDQMIDLNNFVPANSDLTLTEAVFINDSGEIAGFGTLPNGDQHAFILIPCDGNQANGEACGDSLADSTAAAQAPPVQATPRTATGSSQASAGVLNRLRGRLARQSRGFGTRQPAVQ